MEKHLTQALFLICILSGVGFARTVVPPAPSNITSALAAGTADAGTQLVWHNQLLAECTTLAISFQPAQRDSFPTAKQKFSKGFCYMSMCMTRSVALDFLAQSSPNPANGGTVNTTMQATYRNTYNSLMAQVSGTDCDIAQMATAPVMPTSY
jgi:hypothetical protein